METEKESHIIVTEETIYVDREATILMLMERDGYVCQLPGCDLPFDPDPNDRHSLSIDHIYPQSLARAADPPWTFEQIWALENLQLMGRSCNAKKSNLLYREDGTLPFPHREPKADKSNRKPVCGTCLSGRLLLEGEICADCGSDPQPKSWPRYAQKSPKDCSHGWTNPMDHCWLCLLGDAERAPASRTVFGVIE